MFEELRRPVKEKERLKSKAYATIMTNFGGLNVELHGDRAPKTVFNFVQLAKQGFYDNVVFHRLIPGFMVDHHWILIRPTLLMLARFKVVILQGLDEEGSHTGGSRFGTSTARKAHTSMMLEGSW